MNCFSPLKVSPDTTIRCHRPPGHDGKCQASLDGIATVHWDQAEVAA